MNGKHRRFGFRRKFETAFILQALMLSGVARGQSPSVFMTADQVPQSKLYRFDSDTQVFAVDTGVSAGFNGVTCFNGEMLVADYRTDAIQRFAPDGEYLGQFASVSRPYWLETDSLGNIYTTNLSASIVTRFSTSGGIRRQRFFFPATIGLGGVDADAYGNMYVADHSGGTLLKLANDGSLLWSLAVPGFPTDISIDESGGRLFLANSSGGDNGLMVFDIRGSTPSFLRNIPIPLGVSPWGIQYVPQTGSILLTSFGANISGPRGFELTGTGMLVRTFVPAGAQIALDIAFLAVPEPNSNVLALFAILGAICRSIAIRRSRSSRRILN